MDVQDNQNTWVRKTVILMYGTKLDYDTYLKVFFSQNSWNPVPDAKQSHEEWNVQEFPLTLLLS